VSEIFYFKYETVAFVGNLSSISTDQIKERISSLGILPELTGTGESASAEISTKFVAQMHKSVYPLISGVDHDRLVYFYSLLADCQEASDGSAQNHIRLLKKLKSTAAGNS